MKKTKLLTSIAALALVLGLGACETNTDVDDVTTGGDESSSETTTDTTTEEDDGDTSSPIEETCEHEWGEWVETTPASCTETGLETRTCTLCGETETRTIDALGHDWQEVSNTATCTEAGVLTETCSRCEATQETTSEALGHDPQGAYSLDDEYPELYHTQKCARCNEDIQEAHILGGTYTPADEYYHTQTCEICGLSVQSAHNFGDTYVDSGDGQHCYEVCDDCGFYEQHNHTVGLDHLEEYESDGTYHWQTCRYCGAKYNTGACDTDSIGYDDDQHWTVCSVCGAITGEKTDHDYKDIVADARGHSMSCECGKTIDFEEHTFEGDGSFTDLGDGHYHSSGKCTKCGYEEVGVHQVENESSTTCSICGATGLYAGGITYNYDSTADGYVVAQAGFDDSSIESLFIPNEYTAGSEGTKPVVGMADGTNYNTGAFSKAAATLKFIGLPESLTHIGNYAFGVSSGVGTITSLYIPANVESIGTYSFRYQVIDELVFEADSKLTEIGTYAFQGCTFTEVELPDSVQTLGTHALRQCTNLEYVNLGAGVTALPDSLFYNDTALKEVVYSDETTSIGGSTFYGCTSLESIVIPQTVTSIGYNAFAGANNLSTIYYGGTAEEWTTLKTAADNNSAFIDSSWNNLTLTVLYYSEEELEGCWHYVAGVPTAW